MMHNTGITSAPTGAAALSVEGPQAVWMTLNEARERAFTGEIVFELDPDVHAYLDQGIVYYAERSTDDPLGRRLLAAGVVDAGQLERGTVRVGDVEHLGRLFDRDPSIDRDAVVVVAEGFTEELITDLANGTVASVRVTAYRHHPSGVHRWFVGPFEPVAQHRPVSAISQIDTVAIDDLPVLPFSDLDDELTIEWDEPLEQFDDMDRVDHEPVTDADDPGVGDDDAGAAAANTEDEEQDVPADVFELSLELAEFSDDLADPASDLHDADDDRLVDIDVHDVVMDELHELMDEDAEPTVEDGMGTIEDGSRVFDAAPEVAISAESEMYDGDAEDDVAVIWPDESEMSPADGETDAVHEFEMPPLSLDDDVVDHDRHEDDADDVPDDVAEAVRRAIAAIETASMSAANSTPTDSSTPDDWQPEDAEVGPMVAATPTESVPVTSSEAPVAGTMGFAPPTMDMRAEVLYQQASEYDVDVSSAPGNLALEGASVSSAPEGASTERTSALRRLIGGLRRGDR